VDQLTAALQRHPPSDAGRIANLRLRPAIANSRTVTVGVAEGKRISVEFEDSGDAAAPPGLAIWQVDGRPVSTVATKWKRVGGRMLPVSSVTTALDRSGKPALVITTAWSYDQQAAQSHRARDVVNFLGHVALRIVQPDALHAATRDEFEEIPCTTELGFALAADALAFEKDATALAADAALVAAEVLCASSLVDPPALAACATIPLLTGVAASANTAAIAAAGVAATANAVYFACVWRAAHPQKDTLYTSTGGGGGGGGYFKCPDIQWYVSYDDGVTWAWIGSEPGGNDCEYAT
jgi:hypothetical protein